MVAPGRRLNRVDGHLDPAVGSILEAYGEGNPRGKLAMEL